MEMGWIRVHRSIRRNWIWDDCDKLRWWLDLLLQANHSDRKITIGNDLIIIQRGSNHTSILKLATRWNIDKKTVKKFLELLRKDDMISYTCKNTGTTITICNYNMYQSSQEEESTTISLAPSSAISPAPSSAISPAPSSGIFPELSPTTSTDKSPENSLSMGHHRDSLLRDTRNSILGTPMDSTMENTMDSTLENPMDKPLVNPMVKPMDLSMGTNNNVNNYNNSSNNSNNSEKEKEGEEGKQGKIEGKIKPSPASSSLSFPSPIHEKIYNFFGEVTYKTWFIDAQIGDTSKGTVFKVNSQLKFNVISQKFKVPLELLLGKPILVSIN